MKLGSMTLTAQMLDFDSGANPAVAILIKWNQWKQVFSYIYTYI